ncbi:MAG: hypothetical protein ACXWWR_08260 [Candidatus Limnocylindrales bacterium]
MNYKMEPFLGAMSSRKVATARPRRRPNSTATRSLAASLLIGHLEMRRLLEHRLEATGLDALDAVVLRMLLINDKASIGEVREPWHCRRPPRRMSSTGCVTAGTLGAKPGSIGG